jgi:flagellar protein FlbD
MITVTRLNHSCIVLNADLIELIEETPDTVVTLTNGQQFLVRESSREVVDKVVSYRRSLYTRLPECCQKSGTGADNPSESVNKPVKD